MEEKLVELLASKVVPLALTEGLKAYSKHVEEKKIEQIEAGKTTREVLGVTHNIVSSMGREVEPMATLSEQKEYEEMYAKNKAHEEKMEIIKNSKELSDREKIDCYTSMANEEKEIKREAAITAERKEIRKWVCNMANIILKSGVGIIGLMIVCGGSSGIALAQNSSGNRKISISHSSNGHRYISGSKYNTPRLANR